MASPRVETVVEMLVSKARRWSTLLSSRTEEEEAVSGPGGDVVIVDVVVARVVDGGDDIGDGGKGDVAVVAVPVVGGGGRGAVIDVEGESEDERTVAIMRMNLTVKEADAVEALIQRFDKLSIGVGRLYFYLETQTNLEGSCFFLTTTRSKDEKVSGSRRIQFPTSNHSRVFIHKFWSLPEAKKKNGLIRLETFFSFSSQ